MQRDIKSTAPDPVSMALGVLGWVLSDGQRAERLLALTGLTVDQLRGAVDDPALLGAVIDFLCAHEPDLLAAARDLGVEPQELAALGAELAA